ncbi:MULTISPECIES: hypothetical protein [Enterococcus]|uniref:DUF805 domain-containing protein n=1 Tax=Enterococcus alishanensis TaxID=1303817 RepID=A0ABS6TBS8_9ENTE|nr:hypothetical protein [Enterococcus alishanensis]MBV7390341.1 hypothetical protein [Enterococcus alishanensis]
MAKIIKIEEDKIFIGLDDQSIMEFKRHQFSFVPIVGEEVEIYGEGEGAVITLSEKKPVYTEPEDEEIFSDILGVNYPDQEGDTMLLIAFIFNILTTIGCAWLLIPLAWMIPMTITSWRAYKGVRPNTTALGVCTLLFVNIISGILMLVGPKNEK